MVNNTDLAALEVQMLGQIFQALLSMSAEYFTDPAEPDEFSGQLEEAERFENDTE